MHAFTSPHDLAPAEASGCDAGRTAEFAMDLNRGEEKPVGMIRLDEKIGGRNPSGPHQDLGLVKPRVWFDGRLSLDSSQVLS